MTDLEKTLSSPHLEKISEAIINKKLILFIGAGISQNVGMLGWTDFLNELLKMIKNDKEYYEVQRGEKNEKLYKTAIANLKKYNLEKAAQCIKSIICSVEIKGINSADNPFFDKIKKKFTTDAEAVNNNKIYYLLKRLFDLGASKIITTNYDENIETALKINNKDVLIPFDLWMTSNGKFFNQKDVFDIRKKGSYLYKIHGQKYPILAEEDYKTLYSKTPNFTNLLKDIFNDNIILFIGCSLIKDRTLEIYKKASYTEAYTISTKKSEENINRLRNDRIKLIELRNSDIKKRDAEIYEEQLEPVLEHIVELTEKKYKEQTNKILYDSVNFDFDSAYEFFEIATTAEQCLFFNAQIDFKKWFTPNLQLHLSLQKAAFRASKLNCAFNCFLNGNRNSEFEFCKENIPKQTHARIIFIPEIINDFKAELDKDDIKRLNVKTLINIHSLTSCALGFICTDQFAEIILREKSFFENKENLIFLGLSTSIIGCMNKRDNKKRIWNLLNYDIAKQQKEGLFMPNDLDFAYLKTTNDESIWEADIFDETNLIYYKSSDINFHLKNPIQEVQKREICLKEFSKIIIKNTFEKIDRKQIVANKKDKATKMNPQVYLYNKLHNNSILEGHERFFKKEFDASEIIT